MAPLLQIEDKRNEKKSMWKQICSLAHTLIDIIMQTIAVHSGLHISILLSLQTDLC